MLTETQLVLSPHIYFNHLCHYGAARNELYIHRHDAFLCLARRIAINHVYPYTYAEAPPPSLIINRTPL